MGDTRDIVPRPNIGGTSPPRTIAINALDYGPVGAFSALTLPVGRQEEHQACKN